MTLSICSWGDSFYCSWFSHLNRDFCIKTTNCSVNISQVYCQLVLWFQHHPEVQVNHQSKAIMSSPGGCLSLQVQQRWTLPAGASHAALLGMVGGTSSCLDCPKPHHHHRPGHQCLHHPRARLLLSDCHWTGSPSYRDVTQNILYVETHSACPIKSSWVYFVVFYLLLPMNLKN